MWVCSFRGSSPTRLNSMRNGRPPGSQKRRSGNPARPFTFSFRFSTPSSSRILWQALFSIVLSSTVTSRGRAVITKMLGATQAQERHDEHQIPGFDGGLARVASPGDTLGPGVAGHAVGGHVRTCTSRPCSWCGGSICNNPQGGGRRSGHPSWAPPWRPTPSSGSRRPCGSRRA